MVSYGLLSFEILSSLIRVDVPPTYMCDLVDRHEWYNLPSPYKIPICKWSLLVKISYLDMPFLSSYAMVVDIWITIPYCDLYIHHIPLNDLRLTVGINTLALGIEDAILHMRWWSRIIDPLLIFVVCFSSSSAKTS